MKKLFSLLLPLTLIACDKTETYEFKFRACCDAEKYGLMTLKITGNDAKLNILDKDINLTQENKKIKATIQHIVWNGILPEDNKNIEISARYNTETKEFNIDTFSYNKSGGFSTDMVFIAELDGFEALNESEKCIEDIKKLTYKKKNTIFIYKDYKHCYLHGYCHTSDYMEAISPSDAIKISQDWDTNNLLNYDINNIDEHKTKPCDVLSNLKKYIDEQKSDNEIVIKEEDKICLSESKDIYFGCEHANDNDYKYYKLSLCDNGKHTLTKYLVFGSDISNHSNFISETQTDNGVLYSTMFSGPDIINILYNNDSFVYVNKPYYDDTNTICEIGKKTDQYLCIRKIKENTRITPSGNIEVKVTKYNKNTEKSYEEYVTLSAEQALSVTENWDYTNGIKMYENGTEIYEKDACIANSRLNNIIDSLR